MNKREKFSLTALIFLIFLIFIGAVASLDSEDLDDICATNDKILYRWAGEWMCGALDTVIEFSNVTIINNITYMNATSINATSGIFTELGVNMNPQAPMSIKTNGLSARNGLSIVSNDGSQNLSFLYESSVNGGGLAIIGASKVSQHVLLSDQNSWLYNKRYNISKVGNLTIALNIKTNEYKTFDHIIIDTNKKGDTNFYANGGRFLWESPKGVPRAELIPIAGDTSASMIIKENTTFNAPGFNIFTSSALSMGEITGITTTLTNDPATYYTGIHILKVLTYADGLNVSKGQIAFGCCAPTTTGDGNVSLIKLRFERQNSDYWNFTEGDYITLTTATQSLQVYLPEIELGGSYSYLAHNSFDLYVATDGSTYWDTNLNILMAASSPVPKGFNTKLYNSEDTVLKGSTMIGNNTIYLNTTGNIRATGTICDSTGCIGSGSVSGGSSDPYNFTYVNTTTYSAAAHPNKIIHQFSRTKR